MPLESGKSETVKKSNLKKLMAEGYPKKQALAIMYSEAGESASAKAAASKKKK